MKKLLIILIAVASCGCSVLGSRIVDPRMAAAVAARVESGNYIVFFDIMDPARGRSRMLSDEWNIELRDGFLYSRLPYVGESYVPVIGRNDGLSFEAPARGYTVKEGKKGAIEVSFWALSANDKNEYALTVYPNGRAWLVVDPGNKSAVSFTGQMSLDKP